MNKEQLKQFKKLWKVEVLTNLLKMADKETKVTRTEVRSLERDLNFINYGFREGIKFSVRRKS